MHVFDLVKTVLDENYSKIDGTDEEKDQLIRTRLKLLQKAYSELSIQNNVAYTKAVTRFAYIYKYVTSHSNLVYRRIRCSKPIRELFKKEQVTLSCLGGGPGSDLVGILKYLSEMGEDVMLPKLKCHILDSENGWADAWSDVDDKMETECKISTFFLPMDVTNETDWKKHSKYLNADLFSMIYFASEIFSQRQEAEEFFLHLFSNMKPGAFLLYVDNNAECFTEWFDGLVAESGLDVIDEGSENFKMTTDEEKSVLGEYLTRFGPVKLEANAAYRILQKG